MDEEEIVYRHDYPNEPIGGDNPYWRCSCCGRSDPEINGRLEGHYSDCSWRIEQERIAKETQATSLQN